MRILIVLLIFIVPSTVLAEIETGYDLYHNLKLLDDPQSANDISDGIYAMAYLKGCIDGLIFMQDVQYNQMFPPEMMSEKERNEFSKKLNFHRLNTPTEGIVTGQMILIYNKFAEKYPKELSGTVRVCIFKSLIAEYGWK